MSAMIDRLAAALRSAAIPFTNADLDGIEQKGFLARLPETEALLAAFDHEALPDYLNAAALPVTSPPPPAAPLPADADLTTIVGIAEQLRSRAVSPVELTEQALARIAAQDGRLNAYQMVFADAARHAAAAAEAEIAAGHWRGPLHGVPVAVKDLLDVVGYPTAAGSRIRAAVIADEDATAVAQLRAAGAVILGKTRMSEFAYSPGSNNAHYGPTANPYDLTRDSGGSSSGSAVATATGMAFAALGSDTGGSIRIPAALCGLVGLKPTHGRTSLAGGVTLSWSLDHLGPLTRSVSDAAALLQVLSGPDVRDGRTLRHVPPFAVGDLSAGVAGLHVAVLGADGSGQPTTTPTGQAAVDQAAQALAAAGATVTVIDLPAVDQLRLINPVILALEAAALHLPWLRTRLDDYGEFMRQRVLSSFVYTPADAVRAQQARAALRARMTAALSGFDVLLMPPVAIDAPPLGIPTPTVNTGLWNCLGWPALSLPTGLAADGLPRSVQIVARPWCEPLLLRVAYAAEQALGRLPLKLL
jgi:Asp-tRNA(Asn)/Glu-tRNA(Gln) amidotransferase A subunit family amidase